MISLLFHALCSCLFEKVVFHQRREWFPFVIFKFSKCSAAFFRNYMLIHGCCLWIYILWCCVSSEVIPCSADIMFYNMAKFDTRKPHKSQKSMQCYFYFCVFWSIKIFLSLILCIELVSMEIIFYFIFTAVDGVWSLVTVVLFHLYLQL